jgi:hypothetical protein
MVDARARLKGIIYPVAGVEADAFMEKAEG